jgi:glycosyltransferase involved in cell wall biosynthesis
MKIAIEALGIHYFGGGRSATINLLQALFELDQENEYLLFINQPEPLLQAPNVQHHYVAIKNRFALRIWAQMRLPSLIRDCDLVHFIKNLGIFGLRMRSVVTIYDMATLLYPDLFPKFDVLYWKYFEKWTLLNSSRIIAISQQTAQDLGNIYGVKAKNVTVIYPSCGKHFRPVKPVDVARIRAKYGLQENYILHVGRIDPKKNISMLIEAFALFKRQSDFIGELVLVGEQYKKRPDLSIYSVIEHWGIQDSVKLVGVIPNEDLPAFYSGSVITVLPSIYEGFGIAALEAMSCGSPLVVNQAGAVTEVVGDSAIVMPESSPTCLADIITDLWNNPARRDQLRQKELDQAKQFSWNESAQKTLRLYQEVVDKR